MRRLNPERWPGLSKVTEQRGGREVSWDLGGHRCQPRTGRVGGRHWWSGAGQAARAGSPSLGGFLGSGWGFCLETGSDCLLG